MCLLSSMLQIAAFVPKRDQDLDLRSSAFVTSPWTMTRSFVLSPIDLREACLLYFKTGFTP